jgi:polar amino acid transport system substrate-binding protein
MSAPRARAAVRAVAVLLCLALGDVASGPATAQDEPSIRVAVEGAYPPFNYLDQNNELQGFEVDLLKALCAAMRTRCTLVQHEWDGIIRGLLNYQYDAIVSSLEITERRAKRIAFSRRYYLIPATLIGTADEPIKDPTPQALAGKRIGAVDRSDHVRYLQEHFRESEIRTYAKLEEANLDLLTGRLDFVLGDKLALSKFLTGHEGGCCRMIGDVPFDPAIQGQGFGVGLRKDDQALKLRFDTAIGEVMANGTYDRIREKYFPFDIK